MISLVLFLLVLIKSKCCLLTSILIWHVGQMVSLEKFCRSVLQVLHIHIPLFFNLVITQDFCLLNGGVLTLLQLIKKGYKSKDDIENYRLISLTCLIMKVFETIIIL